MREFNLGAALGLVLGLTLGASAGAFFAPALIQHGMDINNFLSFFGAVFGAAATVALSVMVTYWLDQRRSQPHAQALRLYILRVMAIAGMVSVRTKNYLADNLAAAPRLDDEAKGLDILLADGTECMADLARNFPAALYPLRRMFDAIRLLRTTIELVEMKEMNAVTLRVDPGAQHRYLANDFNSLFVMSETLRDTSREVVKGVGLSVPKALLL